MASTEPPIEGRNDDISEAKNREGRTEAGGIASCHLSLAEGEESVYLRASFAMYIYEPGTPPMAAAKNTIEIAAARLV